MVRHLQCLARKIAFSASRNLQALWRQLDRKKSSIAAILLFARTSGGLNVEAACSLICISYIVTCTWPYHNRQGDNTIWIFGLKSSAKAALRSHGKIQLPNFSYMSYAWAAAKQLQSVTIRTYLFEYKSFNEWAISPGKSNVRQNVSCIFIIKTRNMRYGLELWKFSHFFSYEINYDYRIV